MKLMIEIRPGEGGDDAKLLVTDQLAIYISYAKRNNISVDIVDDSRS